MNHKPIAGKYVTLHCPHCGHRHILFVRFEELIPDTTPLSRVAYAILNATGPESARFRNGGAVSLRQWQRVIHCSPSQVFDGLRELHRRGFVGTIPFGKKGRVRYIGVADRFAQFPASIAA